MDWLLNHPQIIVFLAFFVIVTLANRSAAKKARAAKEARLRQPNAGAPTATDADRARQAQEEIRRKILARMQAAGAQQRPAAMPRPAEPSITRATARAIPRAATTPPPLPLARQSSVAPAFAQKNAADDPSDESYREASDEITQLAAMAKNAEANRDADFAPDTFADATTALDELNAALRAPGALRRAVILREILGTPLGLR